MIKLSLMDNLKAHNCNLNQNLKKLILKLQLFQQLKDLIPLKIIIDPLLTLKLEEKYRIKNYHKLLNKYE